MLLMSYPTRCGSRQKKGLNSQTPSLRTLSLTLELFAEAQRLLKTWLSIASCSSDWLKRGLGGTSKSMCRHVSSSKWASKS